MKRKQPNQIPYNGTKCDICGIPAVVTHGNSLIMQTWSTWYTPAFVMGGWARKLRAKQIVKDVITLTDTAPPQADVTLQHEQLSLF